jgi:hypothetical protein
MEVSTEALVDMLREVETDDPIDYADLPFGEQELRRLVMSSLVECHNQVEAGNMSVSDIHALYLISHHAFGYSRVPSSPTLFAAAALLLGVRKPGHSR